MKNKNIIKKFNKAEFKKFGWAKFFIERERKEGRHISACLGSAGLTLNDEVCRFYDYLEYTKAVELAREMFDIYEFIREYKNIKLYMQCDLL